MARIPDIELERLKREVSVVRLVEDAGIVLKKHGKDYLGLCPFHADKEPSLVVSPANNLWHCLGACQYGGSVIDWVMKWNGVSFRHAAELLRNDRAIVAASPVQHNTVPTLPAPVSVQSDDQALLNQVIDYYHQTLKQNVEAQAYLQQRGIADSRAIERFKLGYANRTLGYRLPEKNRKDGATLRGQMQKVGLLRSSGHEHFNGSLVIPIIDDLGNVVEVYGRKIRDDLREGTPKHLYLPGPHRGVWNLDAVKAHKEVILCESLIDALTFWCAGYHNVTASYGVEGFTAEHLAAFKQHGTQRVLIAYDRDAAGDGAAQSLAEQLMKEGMECFRIQFPKGMDANEYATKVQPADKSLGLAIRKAQWLGAGQGHPNAASAGCAGAAKGAASVRETVDAESVTTEAVEPESKLESPPSLAADVLAAKNETETEFEVMASPVPASAPPNIAAEIKDDTILITLGDRRYRVRGLYKNLAYEVLKVNVRVARDDALHVDTFDLYAAKRRGNFITQAANELNVKEDVIKHDLAQVLLKLEQLQDAHIQQSLSTTANRDAVPMSDSERDAALSFLKSPDLLDKIKTDFTRCGLVGEGTNTLIGYLAACSRKLDRPLAVVVQSASAAGKSTLMDAVLAFVPEEERIQYSAMTGQSLFYMGQTNLKHKILALVEEEGASRASYALKLLQSEGELTIASTGKDPTTGNLVTQEYKVEGPVMMFLTTTAIDLDPELLNRCLVLSVDESRQQTRAIHERQRHKRTLDGLLARQDKDDILKLHRSAQRLLRPLAVLNPFAQHLTFPSDTTRLRRDHEKYLTLIDTIALIHQYQREQKTIERHGKRLPYIEVTLDDIALANTLAHDVLGRSLDELPPQTRRLLLLIEGMVSDKTKTLCIQRTDYRFSRKEVRDATQWGDTQLRLHLDRLVQMEYLLVHRGGRGQSFVYELLYDGQGNTGQPFVPGLIDVAQLRSMTTTQSSRGSEGQFAGSSRPQRGVKAGGSRGDKTEETIGKNRLESTLNEEVIENALLEGKIKSPSYRSSPVVSLHAASPIDDGQDAQVSRAHGCAGAT